MDTLDLLQWSFDCLLGLSLLWLAWRALSSPDLYKAIILFIAFGLLMALVWVRLGAADVALAEAAIGAGLTGALLLAAWAKLPSSDNNAAQPQPKTRRHLPLWLVTSLLLLTAAGLGYAILTLETNAAGLSTNVATHLKASGVSNPVTAVLLNFRAYDTLLELAVLLLALLGVWSLGSQPTEYRTTPGPVLEMLPRLLVPILILVTAYLLWVGAHRPGGAFQAGSVLGAAGVLLALSGWRLSPEFARMPLRIALVTGLATFIAIAALTLISEGQLLAYPPSQAGWLIFIIEMTATLSIGAILAALFLGAPPETGKRL